MLVLKEFTELGSAGELEVVTNGLNELLQGAELLVENEIELRQELQQAASGMNANEMPMNSLLMGRYQNEDLLNS